MKTYTDVFPCKWLGKEIYHFDEIDSTNAEAKRLAEADAMHGTVLVAESQTAGRGRLGRHWTAPVGSGILCSLILRPDVMPDQASPITLVAAMAVAKAIEKVAEIRPQIKWPNDVILSGKKVCGILTEMSAQPSCLKYLVVGIGINVKRQTFPEEIAKIATSLEFEQERAISRKELLEAVLEQFEIYYEKYMQTRDVSLFLDEYQSYLVNQDEQVNVLDPKGAYTGIARGINKEGALLVEREGELVVVNSGEVSVRGVYGYAR